MFANILGKNKKEINNDEKHQLIVEKVSKMNLSDMRTYVNNKLDNCSVCDDGLIEIMKRLNTKDENTEKAFIEDDAMDSKKKKAFDLVILVASKIKTSVLAVELVQEFMEIYKEMIKKYDKVNKQIYKDKLQTALKGSIKTINLMSDLSRKDKLFKEF